MYIGYKVQVEYGLCIIYVEHIFVCYIVCCRRGSNKKDIEFNGANAYFLEGSHCVFYLLNIL